MVDAYAVKVIFLPSVSMSGNLWVKILWCRTNKATPCIQGLSKKPFYPGEKPAMGFEWTVNT